MYKILKILFTVIIFAVGIAALALAGVKDASTNPAYCALCHQDPYYTSWESGGLLASSHAQAGIPCQTCHPRTLAGSIHEITAQVTGDYQPLIMELAPLEACTNCHQHDVYEELIPLTAKFDHNPHDSHWGKMECNICHLMHRDSVDYCSKCHDPLVGGIEPYWQVVVE